MNTARFALPFWLRILAQQLGLVLAITLTVSAGLVLLFRQAWTPTLIYSFFISLGCSICIQGLRYGASWLLSLNKGERCVDDWPGWPLMIFSLVAGTWLGYSIGNEIGNLLTGYKSAALHDGSLRRALTIMMIALIPGFALTFFYIGRSRVADAEARAQRLQRQAAEAQLSLLASQLEPHMLFNTLANLRVLIGMDPARAQAMLDRLIAFLRATLQASRSKSHPLREEFARLGDYLALMQVRMGARLRTELSLPAELAELPVPPLLLQPLVENAINHGLESKPEGGHLQISASVADGMLTLQVRDNGLGLAAPKRRARPGNGLALKNIRERLAARYDDGAALSMDLTEQGCCATLRLPTEKETAQP